MSTAEQKHDYPSRAGGASPNGRPAPALRLTPGDAGRPLTLKEFEQAEGQPGWRYELIDGRLEVFPEPDLPHDAELFWLNRLLLLYREAHPGIVNHISNHARVFIPGRRAATCPQPDLALYREDFLRLPRRRHWRHIRPFLVAEILSPNDPGKDLVRNVGLYLQAPFIREYWVIDGRGGLDRLSLRVYRRRGGVWLRPLDVPHGSTYSTRLLPGFSLLVDPLA
jgi:Uma2 family endonuclease